MVDQDGRGKLLIMGWYRSKMRSLVVAAVIGLAGVSGGTGTVSADTLPIFKHVYLLDEVQLYDAPDERRPAGGALAPGQVVTVVTTDAGEFFGARIPQWYQIETWIGRKWIQAQEAMFTGTYRKENRTATMVGEAVLYDKPGASPTVYRIAPQQVRITASFIYNTPAPANATALLSSYQYWYEIETWLGRKWIHEPSLLEDVDARPVSYTVFLTGKETVYPWPFAVPSAAETLEPQQAVRVTGEWQDGFGPWQTEWLRVQLPQGERWIAPVHPVWKDYRTMNETITLLTETRYFAQPGASLEETSDWLPPGDYEAFEATGAYVHIRTETHGDVWVNPSRALLERPLGIVAVDEVIQLSEDSRYYRFPAAGEISHPRGFYAPQTVRAFERWDNEEGQRFYHFHSYAGDEWVLVP
jgi:hypothetical protein